MPQLNLKLFLRLLPLRIGSDFAPTSPSTTYCYLLTYFHLLLHTTTYYYLLLPTATYYYILLRTTTYYYLLLPTTIYYYILPRRDEIRQLFCSGPCQGVFRQAMSVKLDLRSTRKWADPLLNLQDIAF